MQTINGVRLSDAQAAMLRYAKYSPLADACRAEAFDGREMRTLEALERKGLAVYRMNDRQLWAWLTHEGEQVAAELRRRQAEEH